jgi:hypothetical protein
VNGDDDGQVYRHCVILADRILNHAVALSLDRRLRRGGPVANSRGRQPN